MSKSKVKSKNNSNYIFKTVFIILLLCLLSSFALNGFTLYKIFSKKDQTSNSTIQDIFTSHYVTSSEVIKSKTYYMATHYYEQTADGGKMHACIYDAYDKVHSNSSEIITFKIVLQTSDERAEFNFSAYPDTTWANWCNSSFNKFSFDNQITHLAVADDGHIIFNFDTN